MVHGTQSIGDLVLAVDVTDRFLPVAGSPLGKLSMSRFSLWVGIRVHDNKLRPIPVHTGNPQQFAQRWLRNAGELARIDPSLGMAEFIGEVCHPAPHSATLAPWDQYPRVWSWFLALRPASHRRIVSS